MCDGCIFVVKKIVYFPNDHFSIQKVTLFEMIIFDSQDHEFYLKMTIPVFPVTSCKMEIVVQDKMKETITTAMTMEVIYL